ncbi:hypothetical protein N9D31_01660 [Oligoflexaceae bacterium]|nr:hypothetical protein [Oligoflexaceae bacterium]
MMQKWLAFALFLLLAGCYGVPQDRLPSEEDAATSAFKCERSMRTACIQGTVTAAPDIVINGKTFLDSEDFALMFKDLVTVQDKEGDDLSEEDYKVELLTGVTNQDFTRGFEVFVKGSDARTTEVLRSGAFLLNYLRPGLYDVRAQKKLVFKVTPNTDLLVETKKDDGEVEVAKASEKYYCATLQAEKTFEVQRGDQITPVFDEFELYWRDQGCKGEELQFGVVRL